jgi:hypothetical protein
MQIFVASRTRFVVVLFSWLAFQSFAQQSSIVNIFTPPLDIPLLLSGNYGEIRTAHFHTGIDFLTEQGKKVYAAAEGYISRISIQTNGYGKALYITHPNGFITVYGHLKEFTPEIEKYVTDHQYSKKRFEIVLYPPAGKFPVKQKQWVAFSGNTGFSFGSHLHFEIRDQKGDIPLNVLKFNLPINDTRKPSINYLAIYPADEESWVADSFAKLIIPLKNTAGDKIVLSEPISVWGKIGFGIETYDFLDGSANECSPYSVSLMVDDTQRFSFELDKIPFQKSSYIDSHIDYAEKISSGKKIQKLFRDPNNRLNIYSDMIHQGISNFTDSLEHRVAITVSDANNNRTSLTFRVKSEKKIQLPSRPAVDSAAHAVFYYDSLNVFETDDIRIVVPEDALFTNIVFNYHTEMTADTLFSLVHCIHNELTPLHLSYIISIKPVNLPRHLTSKALIAKLEKNNELSSAGGNYTKGFVTTRTNTFGKFVIAIDSLPPEIAPVSFLNNNHYSATQIISFRVKDNLSGINSYNGFIDGNWALFEYDAKNDLLFYKIDASRLSPNQNHTLELIITDNKNNIRKFTGSFYF